MYHFNFIKLFWFWVPVSGHNVANGNFCPIWNASKWFPELVFPVETPVLQKTSIFFFILYKFVNFSKISPWNLFFFYIVRLSPSSMNEGKWKNSWEINFLLRFILEQGAQAPSKGLSKGTVVNKWDYICTFPLKDNSQKWKYQLLPFKYELKTPSVEIRNSLWFGYSEQDTSSVKAYSYWQFYM